MKRVAVFNTITQFESFVNDPKVSVIQVTVNSCQQSYNFQECFIGVVYYEDAPLKAAESPATDRQQLKAAIALVRGGAYRYLTGLNEFNEFERGLETIEQRAAV